jgi:hypothetical protein
MRITRRQFATGIVGATAGVVVFGQAGCSEGSSNAAVSDVILEGGATEAGALALVDAPLLTDATQAASFTWTSTGDTFSASQPLTFCWTSVAGAMVEPRRPATRGSNRSVVGRAAETLVMPLIAEPGTAHAQTAPLTGKAYLLVLSTSKNAKLVRLFTTNHDYTPAPAIIERLAGAGVPIQAVVTTAYFTADAIAKSGGPFAGNAVTFTMTP